MTFFCETLLTLTNSGFLLKIQENLFLLIVDQIKLNNKGPSIYIKKNPVLLEFQTQNIQIAWDFDYKIINIQ